MGGRHGTPSRYRPGNTPAPSMPVVQEIHLAASKGRTDTVRLLLAGHADQVAERALRASIVEEPCFVAAGCIMDCIGHQGPVPAAVYMSLYRAGEHAGGEFIAWKVGQLVQRDTSAAVVAATRLPRVLAEIVAYLVSPVSGGESDPVFLARHRARTSVPGAIGHPRATASAALDTIFHPTPDVEGMVHRGVVRREHVPALLALHAAAVDLYASPGASRRYVRSVVGLPCLPLGPHTVHASVDVVCAIHHFAGRGPGTAGVAEFMARFLLRSALGGHQATIRGATRAAAEQGRHDAAVCLLEYGGPGQLSTLARTALLAATMNNREEVIHGVLGVIGHDAGAGGRCCLCHGSGGGDRMGVVVGVMSLHAAASCGHVGITRALAAYLTAPVPCHHADAHRTSIRGTIGRAVYSAAAAAYPRVVGMLLEEFDAGTSLTPALRAAASLGCIESVRHILSRGRTHIDGRSTDGTTPLHAAAAHGMACIVRELLVRGAHPEPVDNRGQTPLFLAAMRGHQVEVDMLLAAAASPDKPSGCGTRPIDAASRFGIRLSLLRYGATTRDRFLASIPVKRTTGAHHRTCHPG